MTVWFPFFSGTIFATFLLSFPLMWIGCLEDFLFQPLFCHGTGSGNLGRNSSFCKIVYKHDPQ